jgi:Flp pilus assembly protein TadD
MRLLNTLGVLVAGAFIAGSLWQPKPLEAATSAADYRLLGLRYRQQDRLPEAIAAFKQAVVLEPDNLSGRVTLGWTLHLAGQEQAAADELQRTLHRDLLHVPTLNALGIVYLVNDDLAAATLTHKLAAILAPDNEIAHYNLSLAFQRLQYYSWAIESAETAAKLEPTNPHPLVALAIAHWANGDRAKARQAYQQAIDLDRRYENSTFLNHLTEAGFSSEQIETTNDILSSSSSNITSH